MTSKTRLHFGLRLVSVGSRYCLKKNYQVSIVSFGMQLFLAVSQ